MKETYEIGPGRTVTVTIEASAEPGSGERLYTAREVGDLQASEAELVAAPLRRKLAETERELARRTEERDEREAARATLEARIDALTDLVSFKQDEINRLENEMSVHRQSAVSYGKALDDESRRAKRAEKRLAGLERKIDQAREILTSPQMIKWEQTAVGPVSSWLSRRIRDALKVLGSE